MNQATLLQNIEQLNFTAIDFETANEQRNSPCSLGIVKVVEGIVVSKKKIMIRPKELRFARMNVSLHGINGKMVEDAQEFDQVWYQIESELNEQILLAHNADFDIDVLFQTLKTYSIKTPKLKYICTQKLAQDVFSDLDRFRLVDVAEYLNLEFRHHNCLEDANICAQIGIHAIPKYKKSNFSFNYDDLTYKVQKSASEGYESKDFSAFEKKSISSNLLKPNLSAENKDHPFYLKRIVFTGDLNSIERQDAAIKVQSLGGDINTAISKKTDIVIVGKAAGPSKMRKIEELKASGIEIRLIYENEFLKLIS